MDTVGIGAKWTNNFCDKAPTYRCQNDGTCVEGIGSITHCICPDGFSGVDCRLTSSSRPNSTIDATKNSCNSVLGISCTTAVIASVVAIAIGAFLLILFLITLMLLFVSRYNLRQKKTTYDVAGSPAVGGVMVPNPVFGSSIEGEQNVDLSH